MDDATFLITGSNGQLGRALSEKYPKARKVDLAELDITDKPSVEAYDWAGIKVILNAAAYTDVDGAETAEGRIATWGVNAQGTANLIAIATKNDILFVHVSTDYVFDDTQNPHKEDEPLSPLSTYGASKAAGDLVVGTHFKHYILRTSFLIGEGKNFVRIMLELGQKGINPSVIADQLGRITFASELVRAIDHLLTKKSPYGTYNVSNGGKPASWAELTREIYKIAGLNNTVSDVSTDAYYKDKPNTATRPLNSVLDLSKIEATGFTPADWQEDLKKYVAKELAQ